MKEKEDSIGGGKLLIFDDQLLHYEDGRYFGTESRILFLNSLRHKFKAVYFFSKVKKVADKRINDLFILPKEEKVIPVTYPTGILAFFWYPIYFRRILNDIRNVARDGDILYLSWPSPVSFFLWQALRVYKPTLTFAFIAKAEVSIPVVKEFLGFDTILYAKFFNRMERTFDLKGKDELVFTMSNKLYNKYSTNHPHTNILYMPRVSQSDLTYKSQGKHNSFHLLYVCGQTATGLDGLISAIGSLVNIGMNLKLSIVGKCKNFFALNQMVINAGLTEKINFLPDVSYTNGLYSLYRDADILVVPTVLDDLPKSVYEAMSFGLPVVAPKSLKWDGILSHNENAWLFNENDTCSLADAVYYLHKNKGLCEAFSENVKITGKEHTIEYQRDAFIANIAKYQENQKESSVSKQYIRPATNPSIMLGKRASRLQWLMKIF
jgi:glycosyltransferase involved in cell wall biosynthesis